MSLSLLAQPFSQFAKCGPFRLRRTVRSLPGWIFQCAADCLDHVIGVREHIDLPKDKHSIFGLDTGRNSLQPIVPSRSAAPIYFDCDLTRARDKCGIVPTNSTLPNESNAKLIFAKARPEMALSNGGALTSLMSCVISTWPFFSSHAVVPRFDRLWFIILSAMIVAISIGLLATPLAAQNPAMTPPPVSEWPGAEIVEGVAFQGDGSVTLERGAAGLPIIAFWRPILFKEDTDKPVAGRMDCKVVATDQSFAEEDFDPDARHDSIAKARKRQGFVDMDRLRDIGDNVRQLDVVGRRSKPRQHYVLSYILVRDGDRLIDIRRNCTFVYGKAISRPDVLPYVYRYTKISYAFEPGAGS